MKHRKPLVMDKEMLELTDEVREVILREEEVVYVNDLPTITRFDTEPIITQTDKNGRTYLVPQEKRYTQKEFTKAELNHLLYLIEANEREGWYWGNKEHYWKRSSLLKEKLKDIENIESI